jgi:hypothetical protein
LSNIKKYSQKTKKNHNIDKLNCPEQKVAAYEKVKQAVDMATHWLFLGIGRLWRQQLWE